jgi:hypothetical protein
MPGSSGVFPIIVSNFKNKAYPRAVIPSSISDIALEVWKCTPFFEMALEWLRSLSLLGTALDVWN